MRINCAPRSRSCRASFCSLRRWAARKRSINAGDALALAALDQRGRCAPRPAEAFALHAAVAFASASPSAAHATAQRRGVK
jgi:hypothetical protein